MKAPSSLGRPFPYFLSTIACILLESTPDFDLLTQRPFFSNGEWLISKLFHKSYKTLFYTGPKLFIICLGIVFFLLILAACFSPTFRNRLHEWQRPMLLVLLSLIFVPLSVALFKSISGVYGPIDLIPYGGKYPHTGFLQQIILHGATAGGRSFPAGHASGGFALMALYYLPVRRRLKKVLFVFGILAGWSMGAYQMARGEHFLSHTLVTMFLALAIITLLARAVRPCHPLP